MNKNKLKQCLEFFVRFDNCPNIFFGYVIYENGTILSCPYDLSKQTKTRDASISLLSKIRRDVSISLLSKIREEQKNKNDRFNVQYASKDIMDFAALYSGDYDVPARLFTHNIQIFTDDELKETTIKKINDNIYTDLTTSKPVFYFFRDTRNKCFVMYDVESNNYVNTSLNIEQNCYSLEWELQDNSCNIL